MEVVSLVLNWTEYILDHLSKKRC
ncbi:hypothetical protein CCP2SC5_180038 [Azospirillaceae bacterium]